MSGTLAPATPTRRRPPPVRRPRTDPLSARQVVSPAVDEAAAALSALGSPGRPLDPLTTGRLGDHLGVDVSGVRIHDDPAAAELADALGSDAFTLGRHVFFGRGRYDVASGEGRRLLAHEAWHATREPHEGGDGAGHEAEETAADAASARDWSPATVDRPQREDDPAGVGRGRPDVADPGLGAVASAPRAAPDPGPQDGLPAWHRRRPASRPGGPPDRVVTIVARLIAVTLRSDPRDTAGRVRGQLARMEPDLVARVVERVRLTQSPTESGRLDSLLAARAPAGPGFGTPTTGVPDEPVPDDVATVPDPTAEVGEDVRAGNRETDQPADQGAGASQEPGEASDVDPGPTEATSGPDDSQPPGEEPPAAVPDPAGEKVTATATDPVTPEPGPDARISQPDAARAELAAGAGSPGAPPADTAQAGAGSPVATSLSGSEPAGGGPGAPSAASRPPFAAPQEPSADEAGPVRAAADVEPAGAADQPTDQAGAAEPAAGAARDAGADPGFPPAPEPGTDEAEAAAEDDAPSQVPGPGPGPGERPVPEDRTDPGDSGPAAALGIDGVEAAPVPGVEPVPDLPAADTALDQQLAQPEGPADPRAAGGADLAAADVGGPAGPETAVTEEAGAPGSASPAEGPGAADGLAGCLGGGAAEPAPAPDDGPTGACATSAAGGAGGSTGDAAAQDAPAADVASLPPGQALAAAGTLPASRLDASLPQVGTSATGAVDTLRSDQSAAPPTLERPSGAAASLDVAAPVPALAPAAYGGPAGVPEVKPGSARPDPPAPAASPPVGAAPATAGVVAPRLTQDQQLTDRDVARVSDSVDSLPTTDPELAVRVGAAPAVGTDGPADPALVERQRTQLVTQRDAALTQGRRDVGEPLGEADIRPHVPPKTLVATRPEGAACPGLTPPQQTRGAAAGTHPAATVDAVAAEQSGPRLRAAVTDAGGSFTRSEGVQQRDADAEREKSKSDAQACVTASHDEQAQVRREGIEESRALRKNWSGEQRTAVETADRDSVTATDTATRDIASQRRDGETKAADAVRDGEEKVTRHRQQAEAKAKVEKEKARKEAKGGILGWIGSKVSAFIEGVTALVKGVFDLARTLVREAIDVARKAAHAVIEAARTAIVAAISAAGAALVAVGGVLLAAFPETRARFVAAVEKRVQRAVTLVNDAADALERGVQALLDALASALDCALQYLQAAYLAALDVLGSVVKSALEAAQKFLDLLAEWAEIVGDIAADPVGWLKNLGRSALQGVRTCLWPALKRAVKEWFNAKVEEVIGVGKMILTVLLKGCLKLSDIGRLAWEGIRAALPGILIQLLIEKLVSLLIPAGAALALIIDGLRAGWAAASRIIAAFQKFMAFLKSVRSGQGAGAFAEMMAAAGVAVLDFLSNFLVVRLKGAGKGVGSALTAMAGRITKLIGRGVAAVGRGVRAVVRAGVRVVRRGVAALGRGARRVLGAGGRLSRIARAADPRRLVRALARTRVGAKVAGLARRGQALVVGKAAQAKAFLKKKLKRGTPQERLDAAEKVVGPALDRTPDRGILRALFWARLRWWAFRYGLTRIDLEPAGGDDVTVVLVVNPKTKTKKVLKLQIRIPEIISVIASRIDPATDPDDPDAPLVGDDRTGAYRAAVAARILASDDHPLAFLLTTRGKLHRQRRTARRGALDADPRLWQAGHVYSGFAAREEGRRQRVVVMTSAINQRFSDQEKKRKRLPRLAFLVIGGVAVHDESAKEMAAWLKREGHPLRAAFAAAMAAARSRTTSGGRLTVTPRGGQRSIATGGLPEDEHRSLRSFLTGRILPSAVRGFRAAVRDGIEHLLKKRKKRKGRKRS